MQVLVSTNRSGLIIIISYNTFDNLCLSKIPLTNNYKSANNSWLTIDLIIFISFRLFKFILSDVFRKIISLHVCKVYLKIIRKIDITDRLFVLLRS